MDLSHLRDRAEGVHRHGRSWPGGVHAVLRRDGPRRELGHRPSRRGGVPGRPPRRSTSSAWTASSTPRARRGRRPASSTRTASTPSRSTRAPAPRCYPEMLLVQLTSWDPYQDWKFTTARRLTARPLSAIGDRTPTPSTQSGRAARTPRCETMDDVPVLRAADAAPSRSTTSRCAAGDGEPARPSRSSAARTGPPRWTPTSTRSRVDDIFAPLPEGRACWRCSRRGPLRRHLQDARRPLEERGELRPLDRARRVRRRRAGRTSSSTTSTRGSRRTSRTTATRWTTARSRRS